MRVTVIHTYQYTYIPCGLVITGNRVYRYLRNPRLLLVIHLIRPIDTIDAVGFISFWS